MMQKRVLVSFDSSWILSKKEDAQLPVEVFASRVKEVFNAEILDTSLTDCEFILTGDITPEQIKEKILDLVKTQFSVDSANFSSSSFQTSSTSSFR